MGPPIQTYALSGSTYGLRTHTSASRRSGGVEMGRDVAGGVSGRLEDSCSELWVRCDCRI